MLTFLHTLIFVDDVPISFNSNKCLGLLAEVTHEYLMELFLTPIIHDIQNVYHSVSTLYVDLLYVVFFFKIITSFLSSLLSLQSYASTSHVSSINVT